MTIATTAGNLMIGLGLTILLGAAGLLGARVVAVRDARAAAAARAAATESVAGEMVLVESVAPFYLDKTEVTVAAYRACVDGGACTPSAEGRHCNGASQGRDDHPINCVDHAQADAYCRWVGRRLPTAPEWAAAGCDGGGLVFDEPDTGSPAAPPEEPRGCYGRHARFDRYGRRVEREALGTCGVTEFPQTATKTGLLGMAGNVSEWTSTELTSGTNRFVDMGGNWNTHASRARQQRDCRSTSSLARTYRDESTGFRCARTLPGSLWQEIME